MSSNRYVGFVCDDCFEECVRHVCNAFDSISKESKPEDLQKHGIDPIKMSFDMYRGKMDLNSWMEKEKLRQDDKTVNNTIGDFHQMLLGCMDGWTDLGIGDDSHLDLKKDDDTTFMELKNKENTVNSDSKKQVRIKLEEKFAEKPNAKCYWAYIVAENGLSEEKVWWPYVHANTDSKNENILRISGSEVYRLVTGDGNNLERVWRALPEAIKNVCGSDFKLEKKDMEAFELLFKKAF